MDKANESTAQTRTSTKKEAFLEAYRQSGVIYPTCKELGIGRRTVYDWLQDPEFKQRFQDAHEDFVDLVEAELYRRIKDNTIKGKNDLALFCALKGNRREKFGDNITFMPQESLIKFRVVRVEAVDCVKPDSGIIDVTPEPATNLLTSPEAQVEEMTDGEEDEQS